MRLFNEKPGQQLLRERGVAAEIVDALPMLGLSSICNLVGAIKTARYYGLGSRDWIFLPLTDAMDLYGSRLAEQRDEGGTYTDLTAAHHLGRYLEAITTDHLRELTHRDQLALHNLKYFTWVEQQGRTVAELRELWEPEFWDETFAQVEEWDEMIREFNGRTGLG
jgi:hypothetical protein